MNRVVDTIILMGEGEGMHFYISVGDLYVRNFAASSYKELGENGEITYLFPESAFIEGVGADIQRICGAFIQDSRHRRFKNQKEYDATKTTLAETIQEMICKASDEKAAVEFAKKDWSIYRPRSPKPECWWRVEGARKIKVIFMSGASEVDRRVIKVAATSVTAE